MAAKWQQWMPLYIDRFLGSMDVQAMAPEAFKAYLRLLLYAWQTDDCTVPSNPAELAALAGVSRRAWAKHSGSVLRKFQAVTDTVTGAVTDRLRNAVEFELWTEAKRVHDARKSAASQTNELRSPGRSPSRSPGRSLVHNNNPLQEQEQEQGIRAERAAPPSPPRPSSGANGEFLAATWLGEELRLALSPADVRLLADVIRLESPDHGDCEVTADWLRSQAKDAADRGEAVTVWWFKDRKFTRGMAGVSTEGWE